MGIFVIITSLLSLVTPILSKQIVDLIVERIKGIPVDTNLLVILLLVIIATDIFTTCLIAFSQWIGDMLSVRLQTYLANHFYQHLLSLHIGFYDNQITGNLINKMYRGVASITEFIQNMLNNFLPFLLTALVTVFLLSWYSLIIGVLLAVLFPLYILISHGSTVAWGKYEGEKNRIQDVAQGRVFESLSGIRVVKAFAAETFEHKTFLKARKLIEQLTIGQTKQWHIYDFIRRFVLNIILFAIFAYIVYWTYFGRFSIGEMTLLLQLVNQARFPLFAMSFILGQVQQASAGSKDYFGLMHRQTEIVDKPNARNLAITPKNKIPFIAFNNVSFNYDGSKEVLQSISLAIRRGNQLALVGESGQGKSTIVNLLLRFYEPSQGIITIAGQNIQDVTQESLHRAIAVVFQESLLFSGTIADNIRYGKPNATEQDLIRAAKAANAHEFIATLPDKYESIIGERGVKLSGGQKQRIAIARAMLKDAPIIILDEATSSLDSKSEVLVQQGLDRLMHGRTSIIIAHRLSTIANADHVLVIAKGGIAQYGTAKKLLKDKRGIYAQMVHLQQELLKLPSEKRTEKLKEFDLVG